MNKKTSSKITTRVVMKKLFGFMILFGFGSMLFSSNNIVHAETPGTEISMEEQFNNDLSNTNRMLDSILKLIYALLWPVLFIAGLALDNTLVYGSFLHLDASLWSLWNIMKNFANFALGFMVLFAIVRNIFYIEGNSSDKWGPKEIIKKTLIAGVLIQMSWFLLAATIDVSTILTYSIGGLPMTVLENNPKYNKMPVMGVSANLGTKSQSNTKMALDYYHTYGDKKLGLCDIRKINGLSGSYIVGREKIVIDDSLESDKLIYFESGYCALGGWPYKYEEYMTGGFNAPINSDYKTTLDSYLSSSTTGRIENLVNNCSLIPVNAQNFSNTCSDGGYGAIGKTSNFFSSESNGLTVDGLLEKSKGFVGPFIAIYSSLLDFSSITTTLDPSASILEIFFSSVIKVLFAVALFFPVLALAVVLISRIGILWLTIAISPILILLNVFKDALGDNFKGGFEMFSITNLVKLIFAPVFVVFAISMSLIFLTALTANDPGNKDTESFEMGELGMEMMDDGKTYSIHDGLTKLKMDLDIDAGLDSFGEFIIDLFAIGIIWFFLFFAVKMTGTVGASVGKTFEEGVRGMVSKIPVVPIPGGGRVGMGAASGIPDKFTKKITGKLDSISNDRLKDAMPWLYDFDKKEEKNNVLSNIDSGLKDNIISSFGGGVSAAEVWDQLDSGQKETLAKKGVKDSSGLSDIYNTYVSNNMSEFVNAQESMLGKKTNEKNISTYDAENLDNSNIENMANSGGKWGDWAKGVLGGNVKTAGGTYVMVNQGTHASPEFKLVSQDDYSRNYLGQTEDGKYDEETSNNNIRSKIQDQYIKEHGEMSSMKEEIKAEMDSQIKSQQKEVKDRIVLLNSKIAKSDDKTSSQVSEPPENKEVKQTTQEDN